MTSAVIVSAGKGARMGPDVDKLFLDVAGKPVIAHTWARFDSHEAIGEIVLVVREGMQPVFAELGARCGFKKPFRIVAGGKERQDSVWNGVHAVASDVDVVAIHDGARPCTSTDVIHATIQAARECGAAVAAQRVTDTLKCSDDGAHIAATVDRSRLWSVQTPQVFRVEVIRRALEVARERGLVLTDDTAACELIGQRVRLVECRSPNPKVTTPADLAFVASLLAG
jgi:2-C-methyl-D-erythritol 4-phosphate cytidylyltransferase